MVSTGRGAGSASLETGIKCVRYSIIAFNIFSLMLAIALLALCIWLKTSAEIQDFINQLNVNIFYIGVYFLIIGCVIVIIFTVLGCFGVMSENVTFLKVFVGFQVVMFLFGIVGSALLLDFSTVDSKIQPIIRESMLNLISDSRWSRNVEVLRLIQETIGCCGADGANDYLTWNKPLPPECRDEVTGNVYFYGCKQEITFYLEDKSMWVSVVAMILCFVNVINTVCTLILIKAKQKEEQF